MPEAADELQGQGKVNTAGVGGPRDGPLRQAGADFVEDASRGFGAVEDENDLANWALE